MAWPSICDKSGHRNGNSEIPYQHAKKVTLTHQWIMPIDAMLDRIIKWMIIEIGEKLGV